MILVAGGTGRLGSQVVAALLARGQQVRVLARGARPAPPEVADAETLTGSLLDEDAVDRAMSGVDTVVSAVTGFPFSSPARVDAAGNQVLVRAAERAGAEVVLVSVAGASPGSRMGLFRAKHEAEQALARADARGTVIRPEAFADLWIELLTTTATRSHRPLVFGRGDNPIGWVAVRDVAALVVRSVEEQALRGATLTISGPERMTLRDLADRVMAAHGWAGAPRHVPPPALRVASLLPGRAGRQAEAALAMDETPAAADDVRSRVPGLPVTPVAELLAQRVAHHD
jgi:NADH dehydrogenase